MQHIFKASESDEFVRRTIKRAEEDKSRFDSISDKLPDKLIDLFGTGDKPGVRKRFYQLIADLVRDHQEAFYSIVKQAAHSAKTKDDPSKYFCVCVKNAISREGFTVETTPDLIE